MPANAVKGNTNISNPKIHHLKKNDWNKRLRRTTNPLEKAGIIASSSYTIPPRKSTTRVPSITKQTPNNKDKETGDLRIQIKLIQNSEEHPQPKERPGGLRFRRPYSNQHRFVKEAEFCSINNANTFKLLRTITNALRYKSDPSGNFANLPKHSFYFCTYKLLNKNLNFTTTSKRYNKNQLSSDL